VHLDPIVPQLGELGVFLSQRFLAEPERFVYLDPIISQPDELRVFLSQRPARAKDFSQDSAYSLPGPHADARSSSNQ
jgi:hypothetical protein